MYAGASPSMLSAQEHHRQYKVLRSITVNTKCAGASPSMQNAQEHIQAPPHPHSHKPPSQ
eukprot:673057-Pelagomonas_calceolata.AAC.2